MMGCGNSAVEVSAVYAGKCSGLADSIEKNLSGLGLILSICPEYETARKTLETYKHSIVIINYEEIGYGSIELCKLIRNNGDYTIIVVIMENMDYETEEILFDIGVNDVVHIKHTTENLLSQRIKSHLLHSGRLKRLQNIHTIQGLVIDLNQREVYCNGRSKKLRGITYELLKYFIENSNRVITRQELFDKFWYDSICTEPGDGGKTIDVTVSTLRKIIEIEPSRPAIIESVRGAGWKFNVPIML